MASSPCSVVMARHDDEDYQLEAKPPDRNRISYRDYHHHRDYDDGRDRASHRRTKSYNQDSYTYSSSTSYGRYSPHPPEPRRDVGGSLYRRSTTGDHSERRRMYDASGRSHTSGYSEYSSADDHYSDWDDRSGKSGRSERSSVSTSRRYDYDYGNSGSPSYGRSGTAPSSYQRRYYDEDEDRRSGYGRVSTKKYSDRPSKMLDSSDHSSDSSSTREEMRSLYKVGDVDQKPASSQYSRRDSVSSAHTNRNSHYSSRDRDSSRDPKRRQSLDRGSEHSARSTHSTRSNHSAVREDDRTYSYRRSSTDPGRSRRYAVGDVSVQSVPARRTEDPYSRHRSDGYHMAGSSRANDEYTSRSSSRGASRREYDRDRGYDDYYRRSSYDAHYGSGGRTSDDSRRSPSYDRSERYPESQRRDPRHRQERRGSMERRSSISRKEEQKLLPPLAPIEDLSLQDTPGHSTPQIDDSIDSLPKKKSLKKPPPPPPKPQVKAESPEEALDNKWADKWKQQQGSDAGISKEAYIEILPGVTDILRRTAETKEAIGADNVVPSKCWSCSTDLFCLQDLSYIICPKCEVISPAKVSCGGRAEAMSSHRHGVAIGFSYETFAKVQSELLNGIP